MVRIDVVIPVFNSAEILPHVTQEVSRILSQEAGEIRLILVDDASEDPSWDVMKGLVASLPCRVRCLRLNRNSGQHVATYIGIFQSDGEAVLTMDDDLQHSPLDAMGMVERVLDGGMDLVYGIPRVYHQAGWRQLAGAVARSASQLAHGRPPRKISSFRCLSAGLRRWLVARETVSHLVDNSLIQGAKRVESLDVDFARGNLAQTRYTLGGLIQLTGLAASPSRLKTGLFEERLAEIVE